MTANFDLPDPLVCDEIVLLTDIIVDRQTWKPNPRSGTSDEDLLAAIENAEPHLQALKQELRGRLNLETR